MYSDSLFNIDKLIQNFGEEEGAQILSQMVQNKPNFLIDTGIRENDIWARADLVRRILDLIEDETLKNNLKSAIHFTAGVMPDLDSVENRFDAVENLENTIKDFKESGDEFADKLIAIGSCGIDHDWDSVEYEGRDHDYFDFSTINDEKDLFALQLTLGKKLNMPVIVHSRKGFKDTQDVLQTVKWNKGIIHGFAYTKSEIDFFLDLGWYISFSGTVTYGGKKNFFDMSDLVTYVPKDRILIETDSPYYAPVPLKNTINTPLNINYIYEYVAAKRNIPIHKLCELVDNNLKKLIQ
ncbi:MAG: TatD family hydrolase [Treponema sp.]|nr:TatD family hydrolase [Treponema sp.]